MGLVEIQKKAFKDRNTVGLVAIIQLACLCTINVVFIIYFLFHHLKTLFKSKKSTSKEVTPITNCENSAIKPHQITYQRTRTLLVDKEKLPSVH